MLCLDDDIDRSRGWRTRGVGGSTPTGAGGRAAALRRRKRANAPFALHGNGVAAGTVKYLYYSNSWQVLETRWNGTAATDVAHQYVWSQMYIDAMVLRDTYSGGTIQPAQRIYYQHDANFNTTAIVGLVGGIWQVTQRYVYTPYGVVTVLNPDWTTAASQIPLTQYLHQGGRLDPITGLYLFRHRDYSPTLGNWIEQDPAGYVDGGNTYGYVGGDPAAATDFSGYATVRVAAKSFIHQPMRDGSFRGPLGFVDNPLLRAFAAVARRVFNDHPKSAREHGTSHYRLFTEATFKATCLNNGGKPPRVQLLRTRKRGGQEGFLRGTIHMSKVKIVARGQKVVASWEGWGRPNAATLVTFDMVRGRDSVNIWHKVRVTFWCSGGRLRTKATLPDASAFPSHRVWLNGVVKQTVKQHTFADLWRPLGGKLSFVI